MIPIICKNDEKKVGFLKESIKAEVTEERNGSYELMLEYPVTGEHYSEIIVDRFIKAKPNITSDNQFFRIYEVSKPIHGIVTVKAEHVSYALSHYPIKVIDLTSTTAQAAINCVLSVSSESLKSAHSFKVGSCDIETIAPFKAQLCSARAALGGIEGSILDTYGGEFEFNNYTVNLHKSRGADRGVKIAYGKNMTDLKLDISLQNSYTGIYPYCKGTDDTLVTLDEGAIHVENESGIAERVLLLDCTSMFEDDEEKNADNLKKHADEYLANNDINAIEGSMSVSMIDLSRSENYKNLSLLETVSLCDTVKIEHKILAVTVKMKVIKTVYDVLGEKYKTLELGTAKSDFADTIKQLTNTAEKAKDFASKTESKLVKEYKQAIEDATKAITGASGGYVVLNPSQNPSEILILCDSPSISTAQKIWRFNSAGLAYSSSGYDGPYGPALLADGKFIINDITAQTISANLIRAGMLTSIDGSTYFNLDENEIATTKTQVVNETTGEKRIYRTYIKGGKLITQIDEKIKTEISTDKSEDEERNEQYTTRFYSTSLLHSGIKRTVFEFITTDDNGSYVPTVEHTPYIHSFHSTVETCKKREDSSATNGTVGQKFAGFRHYRYVNGNQFNTALGIGVTSNNPTTALELKDSDGNILSRVDFYESGPSGAIKIQGTTYDGTKYYYSTVLELTADYLNVVDGAYYIKGTKFADLTTTNMLIGNTARNLDLYSRAKITCKKPVYMPQSPVISTSSGSTTVEETGEIVIPDNILDYFENSEITVQPSLLITTQSTSSFEIDEETGEMVEIITPGTTTEEKADAYFTSMDVVPDILKDDEETSVNLFTMVHLEWKAIQELYLQLKTAQEEIETLKQQIGG